MRTLLKRVFALYVLSLVFTLPAFADICDPSPRPAATLLFPYFEVDLDDPAGRTALISINNAGDDPTVARLTLWSNLGLPTLGFDILLDIADVQTINLRNLLAGEIPQTGLEDLPAGCSDPLILPELDGEDVQDLRAWHMGLPGRDALCRGIAVEETGLAIGYVTVDAMNQCAPFTTFPGDSTVHPGNLRYFEDGGAGLASNKNVLWGDLILIDPAGDAAQAVAAQHVRADAERFPGSTRTFYGFGDDDRAPLPSTYRGRFLQGQPADTETSFLLWIDPYALGSFPRDGFTCGEEGSHMNICQYIEIQAYDEAGAVAGETFQDSRSPAVRRIRVGEEIQTTAGSGFVEISNMELGACMLIPTGLFPVQAAMIPVLRAEGRFSAASMAVALDSTCSP